MFAILLMSTLLADFPAASTNSESKYPQVHVNGLSCFDSGDLESDNGDSKKEFKLEFDGKENYVVIPKLRYNGTTPITLEALVTPFQRDVEPARSCILGNVELSGLAIHYKRSAWMFHVNDGRNGNGGYATSASDGAPHLNTQVHVAGVFDGTNVRIYIDGKRQRFDDDVMLPHKASMFDFMIGADPDRQGKPHQFFKGTIDEVRISKVARYLDNFETAKDRFITDADTLVLYHFDDGEGEVAKDSSGNKNDGQVHGAKWIKETK
ncbi:MAG: pknB 25 [Planctomycetaceae bacterium]|nr:pknB 25 [Planctomycetaceae bacterium]